MANKQSSTKKNTGSATSVQGFILARLSQMHKTQRWLAGAVGIEPSSLNNWLRGNITYSADWVKQRANSFAVLLECDENELLNRIENSNLKWRDGPRESALSKQMLRALLEEDSPTGEMLTMLQRVEAEARFALSYEACKELIHLFAARRAS